RAPRSRDTKGSSELVFEPKREEVRRYVRLATEQYGRRQSASHAVRRSSVERRVCDAKWGTQEEQMRVCHVDGDLIRELVGTTNGKMNAVAIRHKDIPRTVLDR